MGDRATNYSLLLTTLHEILNIPFAGKFGTIWNDFEFGTSVEIPVLEKVVVIGKSVRVLIDS
jgi:hypothetical protein